MRKTVEAPYFPFYPADWLSDSNVQTLTLEETGVYITLLAYMWRDGSDCSLPDDNNHLSRLLHISQKKWSQLRKVLVDSPGSVFYVVDGTIRNKRLEKEWSKATEKISKRIASANKRWSRSNANASDVHMQNASKSNANASDVHMQNDAILDPDPDPDPDPEKDLKKRERSRAHARAEIIQAYEQTCGPLKGEPAQLDNLLEYVETGMEMELVIHAIRQSSTADRPAKYAAAILQGYHRKGITTLDMAQEDSAERGKNRGAQRDSGPHNPYRTKSITGGRVGKV